MKTLYTTRVETGAADATRFMQPSPGGRNTRPINLLTKTLLSSALLLGLHQAASAQFSSAATTTFPTPAAASRVSMADFDNDGDADILYQTGGNGTAFQYAQSNGNGTYTIVVLASSPFAGLTIPDHSGSNFRAADFDGDGDVDLWVGVNGATGSYFRNDGSSFSSQSSASFPAPAAGARTVVADFDGDGDADILYQTGANGTAYGYYRSNGNGTFTNVAIGSSPFAGLSIPDHSGLNFRVADFDGDGDADVWGGVNGATGSYFRNDGTSFSLQSSATFPAPTAAARTSVADYDGDGDADILYQTAGNGTAFGYYRSNGNGTFTSVAIASSPFSGITLADNAGNNYQVGDVDGDGDFDMWAGAASTFYRQLSNLPPALLSMVPANNAVGVAINANIVLTFNETISTAGTGAILIRRTSDNALIETILGNSAKVTGVGTSTITINPATNLAVSTGYYVQFFPSAFFDADGMTFGDLNRSTNTNGPILAKNFLSFTTSVSALPVVLSDIRGEKIVKDGKAYVKLSWEAASEKNVAGYLIQKSGTTQAVADMQWVAAKSAGKEGAGITYEWLDEKPFAGMNYYRLKMVDMDGSFDYSRVVPVAFGQNTEGIALYPNPSKGTVNITGQMDALNNADYRVHDVSGRLLLSGKVPASGILDLSGLNNGYYIIEVENAAMGVHYRNALTLNR